jgi:hypothetical protein
MSRVIRLCRDGLDVCEAARYLRLELAHVLCSGIPGVGLDQRSSSSAWGRGSSVGREGTPGDLAGVVASSNDEPAAS